MESPINPAVWKFLFHGCVAALSAASVFSLFHERYRNLACLDSFFEELRLADTPEKSTAAIEAILSKLKEDAAAKKGISRLAALQHGRALLRVAVLAKDGSNAEIVSAALKVIVRVFGSDADGCRALYSLNGYRVLLATLSEAYRQGRQELMEETAQALHSLTQVNEMEVVLDADVPKGSEGAYTLAHMPATVKMLRVLDPKSPILFLNALTGIFSNVCALRSGALAIGKGLEGRSGMSYFLQLLEHSNLGVIEHCMRTINYLARAGVGHDELSEESNLALIADNFSVNNDPRITHSVLTVILNMLNSKEGGKFFENMISKTNILQTIFDIWCRSSEKKLRDRARILLQLLSHVPQCEPAVQSFFDRYRVQIAERRAKDEDEARRKEMQQMRQQQMMQQMMLENMGMGNGMDMSSFMGE